MAAPKRTPNVSPADILKMIDGKPDKATFSSALRAARDLALAKGVDPSKFGTAGDLFAWVRSNDGGTAAATPAPQGPASPPKAEKPGKVEDIPVDEDTEGVLNQGEGEKPKTKRGGGRTSKTAQDKDVIALLVANGVDKKAAGKMSPEQRKAALDKIISEARDKKTGTASTADTNVGKNSSEDPPATRTELPEPPKEPIKPGNKRRGAKGGNAAQEEAADSIAPPQKNKANAASETLPEDDGPDPDLVPVSESNKPKLGDRLRGNRAANWGEWAGNPTRGLPDKIPTPVGEVNTPFAARALKEGIQYGMQNSLAPTTWLGGYAAYKLGGPMAKALLGYGGNEQQQSDRPPQMPSQMAPPTADPSGYWQQYNQSRQQPQAPAPQPPANQSGGTPWWDKEVDDQIMSIPAGPAMRSEDTIRRFRGTT